MYISIYLKFAGIGSGIFCFFMLNPEVKLASLTVRIVRYELGKRLRSVKVKSNEFHCPTSITYQSLGGDC